MSDKELIQELKEGLVAARQTISEYESFVEEMKQGALRKATLLKVDKSLSGRNHFVVEDRDGTFTVPIIPKMDMKHAQAGSTVWISTNGAAIVLSPSEAKIESKVIGVDKVRQMVLISPEGGDAKLVAVKPELMKSLSIGDVVLLDAFRTIVLERTAKRPAFTVQTGFIQWSDIGGLKEAKKAMIEAVEMPMTHAELFKRFGKKPVKGVLLYGPPGCGKTMLGKAAATAVAKLHGNVRTPGFFYMKGPEVLSKWVGETEATIRGLFNKAREFKEETGVPAVIFIDEAEALLHHRKESGSTNGMSMTIVPTFLAEMDGLDDSGAMVLLSTNRPDTLDPAVIRDGRINKKVNVSRPDMKDAEEIFQNHLKTLKVHSPSVDAKELEELTAEFFCDKLSFYDVTLQSGEKKQFCLKHIISGAMIAGVVEEAVSIAMHREIETRKPQGVTKEDLIAAIRQAHRQNKDVNHDEDLKSFVETFRTKVVNIQKCN